MRDTLTQVGPLSGGRQTPAWLVAEKAELAKRARRERRRFYAQAKAARQESLRLRARQP